MNWSRKPDYLSLQPMYIFFTLKKKLKVIENACFFPVSLVAKKKKLYILVSIIANFLFRIQ